VRESDAAEAVAQSVERAGQDAEVADHDAAMVAPRKAAIRSTLAERVGVSVEAGGICGGRGYPRRSGKGRYTAVEGIVG